MLFAEMKLKQHYKFRRKKDALTVSQKNQMRYACYNELKKMFKVWTKQR